MLSPYITIKFQYVNFSLLWFISATVNNIIQKDNIDENTNPINKKDIKESIFRNSKNNPLYIWKKD